MEYPLNFLMTYGKQILLCLTSLAASDFDLCSAPEALAHQIIICMVIISYYLMNVLKYAYIYLWGSILNVFFQRILKSISAQVSGKYIFIFTIFLIVEQEKERFTFNSLFIYF